MAITEDRLRQTFSEGGAQEIYQDVKANGDFLGFARQYAFSEDYLVARSALWGLTKASKEDLSQLQVIQDELIDQAMKTNNSSVRRLSLNIVERLDTENGIARQRHFCGSIETMCRTVVGERFESTVVFCIPVDLRHLKLSPSPFAVKRIFVCLIVALSADKDCF